MIVVTVARKPLASANVASNVLEHGTGALHVDASRIAGVTKHNHANGVFRHSGGGAVQEQYVMQNYTTTFTSTAGRWPANLILEHKPGCVRVGDAKVKVPTHRNPSVVASNFCHGQFEERPDRAKYDLADADGTEAVAVWDCEVGCPVAALDGQSGITSTQKTRANPDAPMRGDSIFGAWKAKKQKNGPEYLGDAGGASRYFKQVGGKG